MKVSVARRAQQLIVLTVALLLCSAAVLPDGVDRSFETWMLAIVATLSAAGIAGMLKLALLVQKLVTMIEHLKEDHAAHKMEVKAQMRDARYEREQLRRRLENATPIRGTRAVGRDAGDDYE